MTKIKIYELAKEIGVDSKELLAKARKLSIDAKTHMSLLGPKEADKLRSEFAAQGKGKGPAGEFVPRVTRIPKAKLEEQAPADISAPEEAAPVAEQPAPAAEAEAAPVAKKPAPAAEAEAAPGPAAEKPAPAAKAKAEPAPKEQAPAAEAETEAAPVAKKPAPAAKAKAAPAAKEPAPAAQAEAGPVAEKPAPAVKAEAEPVAKEQAPAAKAAAAPAAKEQAPSPRPQSSRPSGERPQGQRPSGERPQGQRPQGQGYQGNRPAGERPQGQRPQGQGYQGNRPSGERPQGQRPQGQGYQGNRPSGDRPQGQRPASGSRAQGGGKPQIVNDNFPQGAEKPTSNYRPNSNKKVYVKDMVAERSAKSEGKGKSFSKPRGGKQGRFPYKGKQEPKVVMPPVTPKKITIGETVALGELAKSMGKTAAEIIKRLFNMGIMATINQELDADTAILVADEFGVTVEIRADRAAELMEDIVDDDGEMLERPPVVTIMGHVDHGKTSLLDAIRHTNVVSGEAGGITQHIGAYQVEINGKKITFLDTPGHEAFTAMRARGAQMTDIAVVVVAADDGVMPQTVEAINHSKAAGVPIIIAINKIDKPGAEPSRVRTELMEYGLVSEDLGGDTIMCEVSAKARINLDGLLEMILLVAEVGELKANPDRQARGAIVEAKLDKNRGPVATLLVQKGTLEAGDNILAGDVVGKVRAMHDDKGKKIRLAGPSTPVEVLGFSEVPSAGEIFMVIKDEKDARLVAEKQHQKRREEELRKSSRVSLDDLFKQIEEGDIKDLNIVVKADVQGSVEALTQSLVKLNTDEVRINVIHSGVGGVSESDVMLAAASNAIIIGFNIIAPPAARMAAEGENVDIRLYRVIYDCIEDMKKAMSGLLSPEHKENIIGLAEVRQVIHVPKVGTVAGCYILDGKAQRNCQLRIIRNSVVVAEDKVSSLRRFKDDAKEVLQGFECGIGLDNFSDIKEGDQFELFVVEEIAREL